MPDRNSSLLSVLSLIYETVFAPKSWRGLVEENWDGNGAGAAVREPARPFDRDTLERVLPYLEQALDLGTDDGGGSHGQPPDPALLQDLPLTACVVTADLVLLSATTKARDAFDDGGLLTRAADRVQAADPYFHKDLAIAVGEAIAERRVRALTFATRSEPARTILVAPHAWGAAGTKPAAILFFNFETSDVTGLSSALVETYGLTPSEAEVTALLCLGLSVDEIASRKRASVNTVRTQIKNVFAKTGTTRQGSLIALVMNGPAMWRQLMGARGMAGGPEPPPPSVGVRFLQLRDGRALCFGDYGPRDGTPVLFFHHLLGSHLERPEDDGLLERLGVRLIVPDRPGMGSSSPKAERTLSDWVEDVRDLVDHLNLAGFRLAGFSSGGPHAAACAALLGERVEKLGLISSMMPVDELPTGIRVSMAQWVLTGFARHWPSVARSLIEARYRRILENPERTVADFRKKANPADRELLHDPAIAAIRLRDLELARGYPKHVIADELIMLSRDWDFRMSDIRLPVVMWHGGQDDYFSTAHAEALSRRIPNCRTFFDDAWGHFFLYRDWEKILAEIAA